MPDLKIPTTCSHFAGCPSCQEVVKTAVQGAVELALETATADLLPKLDAVGEVNRVASECLYAVADGKVEDPALSARLTLEQIQKTLAAAGLGGRLPK